MNEEIYLLGVDDYQLSNRKQVNTHFYEQSSDELEAETSSESYLERLYGKAKTEKENEEGNEGRLKIKSDIALNWMCILCARP